MLLSVKTPSRAHSENKWQDGEHIRKAIPGEPGSETILHRLILWSEDAVLPFLAEAPFSIGGMFEIGN